MEPILSEYFPVGQFKQKDAPVAAWYVPAGQSVQLGALALGLYFPATQERQELLFDALNLPASQSEQEVLPPELNFPASQKEQLGARVAGLNVPAGQFLHVREEIAPRAVEKVPESHPVHAALACSPDPVK